MIRLIGVMALLCPLLSMCQPLSIKGNIINDASEPVAAASVTLKRTGATVQSNASGEFSFANTQITDSITVSAVGYETVTMPTNERGLLTILLKRRIGLLDEAVVIAYGKSSRRLNTGNVSRLSAADISHQPVSNPLSTLEGRIAGLTVIQSSGVPGASVKLQLRGRASLTQGSEPLFIIDGVPFAPNNENINRLTSALNSSSGSGLSPFATINPADIESIEILKDADATAIYGSRGANGVVLITTKRGVAGKTKGSAAISYGWSRVTRTVDMLNTQQYLQTRREAFANDGLVPTATSAPDLLLWDTTRYTDFKKLLIGGTAHTTNAQASLSGGSALTSFSLSTTYNRETTVFPGDLNDTRGSISFALSHASPSRRFTADFSTLYAQDNNNLSANNLAGFINLPPNAPLLYTADGKLNWEEKGVSFQNPLAYLKRSYLAQTANWLGRLLTGYKLTNDLQLRTSFGYNRLTLSETALTPISSQNPAAAPKGSSQFAANNIRSWIIEPQLSYIKAFGLLKLDALAGGTWQQNNTDGLSIGASGYANDALIKSLSAAPTIAFRNNSQSQYNYNALFGRISAAYGGRYLLNLSGRRDGSSRFGPGKQFANFGAVGAGWIFSTERWAQKGLSFLSFGKIRGSYGITGNDQIGDYKYIDAWTSASPYQASTALYPAALFNDSYSWEINKKLEAAIDLGAFGNRLLLSVAWYRNRSSNQLVEYVLPTQTGFFSITDNFPALIQNSGWEIEINTATMATADFTWNTTFNFTLPKNKLVAFPGIAASAYASSYVVGRSISLVNKLRSTGIDPATGVFGFEDYNKDGVVQAPSDYQPLGELNPKFFGGLGNTLQFRNWQCQLFIVFKKQIGANWFSTVYQNTFVPGSMNNQPLYVLDRWQKPGDRANVQKYTATTASSAYGAIAKFAASDGGYSDASFARVKTVYLSYRLRTGFLKKAKLEAVELYVQGQNLFTLTSYKGADPETQSLYAVPPLKTIMAGIRINF